ncbi:MAG: LysE family translocator [Cyclobacteriaceae bacterium]|jgi:threonine/homoserine/homoserine lactone efflux protein|nr:LysE family translocator [Cyclobacteriaceae bacterium]
MHIVWSGIKLGILLAFLIGPVFFTLIQTSVERGFVKGALVAVGVSLSDAVYVAVCYFGLVQFINQPNFREGLAYGGGIILIGFGLYHLLIKSRRGVAAPVQAATASTSWRYMAKGFVINGLSPMVLIFWIGTLSVASIDLGYTRGYEFLIFFVSLLLTVFGTDLLKAYLAGKLSRLITARLLRIMNILVGLCLIAFGIRLVWQADTFL